MVDVLETTIVTTIVIGNNIMHITKDIPTGMDHQLTQLTLVPNGIQIKSTFNNIPMEDKYKVVLFTKVQCEERDGINHHNNDRVIHHKAIKDKVVVDQSKGDRVVQVEVDGDNSRMEMAAMCNGVGPRELADIMRKGLPDRPRLSLRTAFWGSKRAV
jgi:hypothetical protein